MRHNQLEKALMNPFKWSNELINEVDKTRIQGPLALSSGIDVMTLTEGDLQLMKAMMCP